MIVRRTDLEDVWIAEPQVFGDSRGYFRELWHRERYHEAGLDMDFVQDNASLSSRGVLRGLHYQHPEGQGKLISVVLGSVFDVGVDIRVGSPTFGCWVGSELSAANGLQMFVPGGFAHGFLVTSEQAILSYKCTAPYRQEYEGVVRWDDPEIGIEWPEAGMLLSEKDAKAPPLSAIDPARLPRFEGE
jgi:dTDP-4-dehydrorhamnose 3,5-epimerase